ncbi:hypothetical protein WJX81_004268 [Elliptochloris bilobata]|uniref:J domain-containing protein n=1 Tax=Elliptochloris bilobata TaxID=381761 RepID=A0AAW1SCW8_9CHLO
MAVDVPVRAALRAAAREAARAAADAAEGRGAPALLRRCLAAHGGALLALGRARTAKTDLAAQLEQAQAQARELAEAAARSQAAARETRAHARRQASAFEAHRSHMAQELSALAQREREAADAAEHRRGEAASAAAARADAARAQAALREVLAARRSAREALDELAAQNARLVSAYCAKKAEVRQLQEASSRQAGSPQARGAAARALSGAAAGAAAAAANAWLRERERLRAERADLRGECEALAGRLTRLQQGGDEGGARLDTPALAADGSGGPRAASRASGGALDDGSSSDSSGGDSSSAAGIPVEEDPTPAQGSSSAHGRVGSVGGGELVAEPSARLHELEAALRRLTEENEALRQQQAAAANAAAATEALHAAQARKLAGNAAFQAGRYAEAAAAYSAGLAASGGDAGLEAALYCNRAACGAALGRPAEAVADACAALALEPGYLRALQRRADALGALGEHAAAAQDWADLAQRGVAGAAARAFDAQRAARLPLDPDHYACLGLPASASPADVRAAFRALALRFHPDKTSVNGPGAAAASALLFRAVSRAHACLSDVDQRRMYDVTSLRRRVRPASARAAVYPF